MSDEQHRDGMTVVTIDDAVKAFIQWNAVTMAIGSSWPETEFEEAVSDRAPVQHRMFRCTVCEKWSHARRNPRWHKRFVAGVEADSDSAEVTGAARARDIGLEVIEETEARAGTTYIQSPDEPHLQEPYDDYYEPPGAWVKCGPFETYVAVIDGGS